MRVYTLARRGLNINGEIEMIYKTNISLEEVDGVEISELEKMARADLTSPIQLNKFTYLMIVTDSKDETLSVVLRENHKELCRILKTVIEVPE